VEDVQCWSGSVTLISFCVIGLLFISETVTYFSTQVVEQLFVDSTSSEMRVDIHFDVTFSKIACDFLSVDVMGVAGESQDAIEHDVFKQRVDSNTGKNITDAKPEKQLVNSTPKKAGDDKNAKKPDNEQKKEKEPCRSCYGAIQGCCNTCEEVKDAYRLRGWTIEDMSTIEQCKDDAVVKKMEKSKGQGCRLFGRVDVGKVGGNFHIAPGVPSTSQHSHYHDFQSLSPGSFDTSHTITHLSFGKPYPGKEYPLDGKQFSSPKSGLMHQYYLKVVPTTYVFANGSGKEDEVSHQFSITRSEKDILAGASGIPGVFMQYEFSPLMVRMEERQRSLSHYLVNLCAICGGVFTVASLVDSLIYSSSRAVQRKLQVGKAG